MPSSLNLAIIGGDGTGPEVTEQGLRVLDAVANPLGVAVALKQFDFSGQRFLDRGHVLHDEELDQLRSYDAIYFGAIGHPDVAPGILERGLLLKMRFDLDQYINLRPVKLYPGISTPLAGRGPEDIDLIVVRENTEDLYAGGGGTARKNTPHEISTQEMLATRFGVERCVRYAFDLAVDRKKDGHPGKLTLVHKTNVLTHAGGTWFRTFQEVAEEYQDITTEYHHVDACCMYMVSDPSQYDVIVTSNMFGDIITDLGAMIAGGMGIAASGNINPDPDAKSPSMFEPVHGSSPDIAGQNKANPLAAIDTLALLLKETARQKADMTLAKAGEQIAAAVQKVTPNFTGKRLDRSGYTTTEIGDMVLDALA
ncbi:MAG: 3-isopropylmalate dehydrogenase [Planctomycetota bacterium]